MTARLRDIFFADSLYSVRVILAFAEFVWAVTLYWPGETFGRPTYHIMQMLANEVVWAHIFLISSLFQILIVVREEFSGKFAALFAAWNSCLWIFVCGSMYMSVYPPPAAISGELSLAFAAVWVFLRTNPSEEEDV